MRSTEIALKIQNVKELDFVTFPERIVNRSNKLNTILGNTLEEWVLVLAKHPISRIYFGTEFCQYLIPSSSGMELILKKCQELDLAVSFLTPPVTNFGINRLRERFELLAQYDANAEIVVNDFGVLELIKQAYPNFTIVFGRIMDKTFHEDRMTKDELTHYFSEEGLKYAQHPGINAEYFFNLVQSHGVDRVEYDYPTQGLDFEKENMNYSVYVPFGFFTTGRMCMMRTLGQAAQEKFEIGNNECARLCKKIDQLMMKQVNYIKKDDRGNRIREMHLFRKGNTIFSLNTVKPDLLNLSGFNRIIVQPNLSL
jgi:hypothetical protein